MLSGNQYIYKKIVFQISAVRKGVCALMEATLLVCSWLINLDLIPFTNEDFKMYTSVIVLFSSGKMCVRLSSIYAGAFLAVQGFKRT